MSVASLAGNVAPEEEAARPETFGALIAALSEPEQPFFSDNPISNEGQYLQASPWFEAQGLPGRAYLGVGPEQNLTFIALAQAQLAFVVDIQRDNLLLHLLYKSLFEEAADPAAWLALWLGRELPADATLSASESSVTPTRASQPLTWEQTLHRVNAARISSEVHARLIARTLQRMQVEWAVNTEPTDAARLTRLCERFRSAQLALRFPTNEPRKGFPTLGQLLGARDAHGRQRSFLADPALFERLRRMQREHRVVPVVGDLAGSHTLPAIANQLKARKLQLGVAYVSNVEQYLLLNGGFEAWRRNLAQIPRATGSVIVRAYFDRKAPLPGQSDAAAWQMLSQSTQLFLEQRLPSTYRELALQSTFAPRVSALPQQQ